MEDVTDIFEELKAKYKDKLNPGLIAILLIRTPQGLELEYQLQRSPSCTITYRHKLYMYHEESPTYTEQDLKDWGLDEDEIEQIKSEPPYTDEDLFYDEYLHGANILALALNTDLFTEAANDEYYQEYMNDMG